MDAPNKLSHKQYASDQAVRWCPGCGDYAILKAVHKTLADLEVAPANTVFVSGIGCASRFPYYVETYGFHTIHGRAAAVATDVKLGNPELDVWIVAGDGDALSIGGNHLLHLLRRNVDVQMLLFNNEIYGLTKGQYSPTSKTGTLSPSSPWGSTEQPVNAVSFALGAGGHFVARSTDIGLPHLIEMLKQAHAFTGTSFVEILQNCIVYNDGAHATFTDKATAPESCIYVEHGKPLIFGKNNEFGLRLNTTTLSLEKVELDPNSEETNDIVVHDETNRILAQMLAVGDGIALPLAFGVIYRDHEVTLDALVHERQQPGETTDLNDLQELFQSGHTWDVAAKALDA